MYLKSNSNYTAIKSPATKKRKVAVHPTSDKSNLLYHKSFPESIQKEENKIESIIWRNTIGDLIRRSARRNPEKDALIFGNRQWTYSQLDTKSNRLAHHLIAMGLKKGDRIAAYGRNSDAYVLLWLAAAKAGLVHVPVNYTLKGKELVYIVNQSGSRALFYDPQLSPVLEQVKSKFGVELYGTLRDGEELDVLKLSETGPTSPVATEVSETDLVQLLYTSGTTSAPKGAMMTHRALVHEYLSCVTALDFQSGISLFMRCPYTILPRCMSS